MKKILTICFLNFSAILYSQNCETPTPTKWHNFHENDQKTLQKTDEYRIQFLSVKHDKPIKMLFGNEIEYVEETQNCFRRFFVKERFTSLQSALDYLPTIQQYYPDAYPLKVYKNQ